MPPRLRLAPTPSGYLHLGNGVNFAINALLADRLGGRLLLRVDDLDRGRVREAYLDDLAATLRWLLPSRAENLLTTATYQRQRLPAYRAALDRLRENGEVYACTCTRRQIRAAQAAAGRPADVNDYPGTCRDLGIPLDTAGAAWRLRAPAGGDAADFVVRQRDGTPAYQLASVVDDVDLAVTHVVRGEDLRPSTAMQRVLAEALARHDERFARFAQIAIAHHPLILDEVGEKLSKSAGSTSLRAWRDAGRQPSEVFARAEAMLADLVLQF